MNIELLTTDLEVTENPGLDMLDPRFVDIVSLVEQGEYAGAATQAEAVLEEGIYDIRITGYFLYGHFLDQGLGVMPATLECLAKLMTDNWEALGPVKNREKHTQTSLGWYFKQLLKRLKHEESKESDVWQQWLSEVSSDDVQDALDTGINFQRAVSQNLEDKAGPVIDSLAKVNDWLKAFQRLVYREPEPEEEPEPEDKTVEEDTAPAASAGWTDTDSQMVEGSYHLKLLLSKMAAFEQLVSKEQYPKAAIVADDINAIIANFDPRVYFPRMFSRYSLLLAHHIGEITSFAEYRESIKWRTMQDLYKVDLNGFVAFEADMEYSTTPSESGYSGDEAGMYAEESESEEDWD